MERRENETKRITCKKITNVQNCKKLTLENTTKSVKDKDLDNGHETFCPESEQRKKLLTGILNFLTHAGFMYRKVKKRC